MKINICNHDCTELWNKVLYKKLSDYPQISDWEIKNIIDFIHYEKMHGREAEIIADNKEILEKLKQVLSMPHKYNNVKRPEKVTECTACRYRKGCMTQYICHTAPIENAIKIFECGSLLSAVNARKLPAELLAQEPRNAAHDPEDFFDYVMFTWGNCQAGDRLVMERKMKRLPTEEDMGCNLTPGVRFYFEYDRLNQHPDAIHDGFLPIKVKNQVILEDYVYAIIVPEVYRNKVKNIIPENLKSKTYYIVNDCKDVWDWSEKVYTFVENIDK
jgi:hypothetical protein